MEYRLTIKNTPDGMVAQVEATVTDKSQLKYAIKNFEAAIDRAGYVQAGQYVCTPLGQSGKSFRMLLTSMVKGKR